MAPKVMKVMKKAGRPPKQMKKPAAAAGRPKKLEGDRKVIMTQEKFDLSSYCSQVKYAMKVATSASPLRLATACSGSGGPTLVLKALGLNVKEITANEINPACAHALLLNVAPQHCHSDVRQTKKCFCFACGRRCALPSAKQIGELVDLAVAGFPCNSNSVQNVKRFSEDPTKTDDAQVFKGVIKWLARLKPTAFVLENVTGCHSPSTKGGDSVTKWILDQLQANLSQWQVVTVDVPSLTLPEPQQSRIIGPSG